ncbi:hypothetical protein BD311DRAFT_804181 [Dichomitus squalens]|uniref:Uncharacterized protein n=1 Tax=Dichomitus squalens TaxID=114155 RepID=A0A4Q9MXE1_9APHY|nr:hypothetical protein BD311DRAFT_804181 [Dichomitus squalens]
MPTYYYPTPNTHGTRQRSYSHSHQPTQVVYPSGYSPHHSSPGHHFSNAYSQQGAHYPPPQYLAPNYQRDAGRHRSHHGHARTGSGGAVYYTSSAPSHHHSSSRGSPHHQNVAYTTSRRSSSSHNQSRPSRSHSVPRPVRVSYDSSPRHRRSESRPREASIHNVSHSHHRRGSSSSDIPLSERIRRMFGFSHHTSSSHGYRYGDPHRGGEYVDTRSGRTVDWRGRPIYRV